jgi:hypothetical protein
MPPKGLVKIPFEGLAIAKNLVTLRMQAMDYGMWPMVTWECN